MLSIVIVALNEEKRLPYLLGSIERQEGPYEVVFVDNGSKDRTHYVTGEFQKRHRNTVSIMFDGVQSLAYELGIEKCKAAYVVIMGADMALPDDALTNIRALIGDHPEYDAFVAHLLPLFRTQGSLNAYLSGYRAGVDPKEGSWKECAFHSGGLVVKRDVALRIGFNPYLPVGEDGDFSYRLLKAGYRAYFCPARYAVFDEQYSTLGGMLRFWKKLGISCTVLLRQHAHVDMLAYVIRTLAEPITPHYLIVRYRGSRKNFDLSYSQWVLAGFSRQLATLGAFLVYGPLGKKLPRRILRKKD